MSEAEFENLRRSAACASLSRDSVSLLLATTAELFAERRRMKLSLERLPKSFGEVRSVLNELSKTLR